jgi:hypothetical protein
MIKELRRQNPKFGQLSISAGDHPSLEADEKECQDLNAKHEWAAYTIQNFGDPDNRAYISLCDGGLRYPSLQDILDEDKAGPGCDALGPDETGLMTSLGGQILHELIHWRYLLRDVPDFQDNLLDYLNEEVEEDEWIITDFDGGDSSHFEPSDGYGPVHARQLVDHDDGDARNNADNYRWYAQTRYFQFVCGREFGPAKENEDNYRFDPPS